ncbi:MAG TPA: ABC transporter permease [Actinopolymorphaceae bacterium]
MMLSFVVRRVGLGVVVLAAATTAVFAIFYVAPPDVARALAGRQATPETVALVEKRLGLDRPIWQQYLSFVWHALHGDLGYDYYHQVPVGTIVLEALPATLSLVVGASILWLLIGVVSGVVSAARHRTVTDRLLTGLALVFYSMPTFLLGLLLLFFLSYRLSVAGIPIFPAGSYVPLTEDPANWLRHLLLPWLTLALVLAAPYTRLTRAAMLDVMGQDYIRTARSKGLRKRHVVYRHALRNALNPVTTQLGIDVGQLIGGVVVTETVFSIDGLGKTAIDAIVQQDLPVIAGIVLFASTAVIAANILVDVAYAFLDPRVRLH